MSTEVSSLELRVSAVGASEAAENLKRVASAGAAVDRAVASVNKMVQDSEGRWRHLNGRFATAAEKMAAGIPVAASKTVDAVSRVGRAADEAAKKVGKSAQYTAEGMSRISSASSEASRRAGVLGSSLKALSGSYIPSVGKAADEAAKKSDGLGSHLKSLVGAYLGVSAIRGLVGSLVSVNREFDKLEAQLVTATGSAGAASKEFERLQRFATQTPFALRDTVDAYTRLVNQGLDPSERAMRSYGDTASAMNRTLEQVVEAVGDASRGEFERMREAFGVTAKQIGTNGEKVALTFRGVTTVVKKSADDIEGYLIKLGETNFAGAMEERMKTLDGSLSNLGDSWDKLFRSIGKSSVGELIKQSVDTATQALEGLSSFLKSKTADDIVAWFQRDLTGAAAKMDRTAAYARFVWEAATGSGEDARRRFNQRITASEYAQKSINSEIEKEMADREKKRQSAGKITSETRQTPRVVAPTVSDQAKKAAEQAEKQRRDEFKSIVELLKDEETKIEDSYNRRQELISYYARKNPEILALMTSKNIALYQKELDALQEKKNAELKEISDALRTEEEELRESYARRRAIVEGSAEGTARERLLARLDEEHAVKLSELRNAQQEEREALLDGLRTEEDDLRLSYEKRRQDAEAAFAKRVIDAQQYSEVISKINADEEKKRRARELEGYDATARYGQQTFATLAELSKQGLGEQSAFSKAMFAASKAFAIAQGTVAIAQGVANAMSLPWPANLAAAASVAAAGTGIIATITSAKYSGAYDKGGYIPAGSVGIVGERGPEFVQGPAMVTGRKDTARIMSQGQQPIRVVVAPDQAAAEQFMTSASGERVFLALANKHSTAIRRMVG